MKKQVILLSITLLYVFIPASAQETISFESEKWTVFKGGVVEHLGRKCLKGGAFLKDIDFGNGIIEVDIAVTGDRSYPEINFHIKSLQEFEHFYIRPHRSKLYTDVLQYIPVINGDKAWQLYSGEGYTSGGEIPRNEWVHIKIEVKDSQARVFINNSPKALLEIPNLYHGANKGMVGLNTSIEGTAYYSNFKITHTDDLQFEKAKEEEVIPGVISDWELSQSFKMSELDLEKTPKEQNLQDLKWQKVKADASGLVNVSKKYKRKGYEPDCVYARTTINAKKDELYELQIGYSDAVMVFFNGKLVFSGNSAYRQRDPSFLGIIGYNDMVYLPLKKGKNEVFLLVLESMGGWGFMARNGKAVFIKGLKKQWESEKVFKTSESILYDSKRDVLYVSNFDQFNMRNPNVKQYISKVSLKGKIIEEKWIADVDNPLGMTIHKDKLYIVERKNIVVANPKTGEIIERIPVPKAVFINDITIDNKGVIYVSDSRINVIWRVKDKKATLWLKSDEVLDPNTMYFHKGKLLFGNSGDGYLKSVNPKTKEISKIAYIGEGFVLMKMVIIWFLYGTVKYSE